MDDQEQEEKKKEILILRNEVIAYNNEQLYRNDIMQPDLDNTQRKASERVQELKAQFYNSFLTKNYKHIVVLSAAGTSLDNGDNRGQTRDGLWEKGKDIIDRIHQKLPATTDKFNRILEEKDIEALLSHILLVEKVNEDLAPSLGELRKELEKVIRDACALTLDKEKAPHKAFLDKITSRKASAPRVSLFTTNYDTLFEQAAQEGGFVVIDGFSFTTPRTFSGRYFDYDIVNREHTRLKDEDSFISKVFHLYKLHGSLNWESKDNRIVQTEKTETPLIVYPASDKYESSYEQPYFEMMSRFQQALRKEDVLLIVLGFGFRDKHIQNVILEAVNQNPNFQLLIVNYNSSGTIDRKELEDYFEDHKVKRNVAIVFDTFKCFTEGYPVNKIYSNNE